MAFIVKNDLPRFYEKLKNWQANGNNAIVQKALNLISEKMLEIAKSEYSGINVNLNTEINENKVTLTASGKAIMFIEFGTGLVGEASGYPKDKLPTETITFESPKGEPQSTQGWEYYYDNPKTKIMGGWFWGKTFTRGQVAGMQMLNTTNKIREYIRNDLAQDIRKGD